MGRLEEFKENKQYILEDALGSITPADNREADIYSFMRSYLNDELGGVDKAELLDELAKCITGQPYDRPEAWEPFYSQKEIDELAAVMDRFIDGLTEGCAEGHLPWLKPSLTKRGLKSVCWMRKQAITFWIPGGGMKSTTG